MVLLVLGLVAALPTVPMASADGGIQHNRTSATLDRHLRPGADGVLVRAPDGLSTPLLPTSWLRNDIHPPTTMYVSGIVCSGGSPAPSTWDGYRFLRWLNRPRTDGRTATGCLPYLGRDANRAATVGIVAAGVAPDAVAAQYPTDAGSDTRCPTMNTDGCRLAKGDPANILNGTGRGCYPHQITARGAGRSTVVGDDCRCPTRMSGPEWVEQLLHRADPTHPYSYFRGNRRNIPYYDSGGRRGKAPMLVLADSTACWTSHRRQLVAIQNALWHDRFQWWNGRIPQAPAWARTDLSGSRRVDAMKYYAGWNEVIVEGRALAAATDAIVIKLPAGMREIRDLPPWAVGTLGRTLERWRGDASADLPVVVLTERYRGRDRWTRHFHAEEFDFLPYGSRVRIRCGDECGLRW